MKYDGLISLNLHNLQYSQKKEYDDTAIKFGAILEDI